MTRNTDLAASLLAAARAVRAAHPNPAAMARVAVPDLPPADPAGDHVLRRALRCLRDETRLVQGGRSFGVGVLDDEIAHTEFVLRR